MLVAGLAVTRMTLWEVQHFMLMMYGTKRSTVNGWLEEMERAGFVANELTENVGWFWVSTPRGVHTYCKSAEAIPVRIVQAALTTVDAKK